MRASVLRSTREQTGFCKRKRLLPLILLGFVIASITLPYYSPATSVSQQIILMENIMSTTTVGISMSANNETLRSNLANFWLTTEEPMEDEDAPMDEDLSIHEAEKAVDGEEDSTVGEDASAERDDEDGRSSEVKVAIETDAADGFQCAICFFGLPRSYKEMVLPSIVKNVLEPNAKYNCDIFVHFYARKKELKGRFNPGGEMDPKEIYALESAVWEVMNYSTASLTSSASTPAVIFSNDTERAFFDLRGGQLDKYLKTRDVDTGKKLYFPWKQTSWKRSSLVNLIRQWHSIENVFRSMENYMWKAQKNYTRVAMLRNDAMYLSPIDILQLDNDDANSSTDKKKKRSNVDSNNRHFVIAPFAKFPVNDRMIYGPYDAIKIWATRRFDLIEKRANKTSNRGMVMHSETFMQRTIIPAMKRKGYKEHVHPGLCFIRTRPDSKALFNDCRTRGVAKGFEEESAIVSTIESILQRSCEPTSGQKGIPAGHLIQC
ncbi:unnamed protein product [Cylindrotheca closterium]|uniref:Uncharacterized protein n=1 Tax=Cylindrotheca closterium TaxID=2856 RepID=A0AAD2JP30_9STRA|nr:unnamed protein product [Cylindrotheca closterium]